VSTPPPAIDAATLRRLTAGRWLLPILAELHRTPEARFGVLVRRLAISRSMLAAGLDTLEEQEWIRRNPGHGHPLRPEYLLTGEGRAVAAWASMALAQLNGSGLAPGDLGRWGLPLLGALAGGRADRFRSLEAQLLPITPRALSMALTQLTAMSLADRHGESGRHPRYALSVRGARLAERLGV
jgi:DNA-binding HxlR family transcriptional regulator